MSTSDPYNSQKVYEVPLKALIHTDDSNQGTITTIRISSPGVPLIGEGPTFVSVNVTISVSRNKCELVIYNPHDRKYYKFKPFSSSYESPIS